MSSHRNNDQCDDIMTAKLELKRLRVNAYIINSYLYNTGIIYTDIYANHDQVFEIRDECEYRYNYVLYIHKSDFCRQLYFYFSSHELKLKANVHRFGKGREL